MLREIDQFFRLVAGGQVESYKIEWREATKDFHYFVIEVAPTAGSKTRPIQRRAKRRQ
jgi:hypothetical protein